MALLQMQRISICGLKNERKPILELLQRKGVIEITDVLKADQVFQKSDVTGALSLIERNILQTKDALVVLDKYSPHNKSLLAALNGRNEVSSEVYDAFKNMYDTALTAVRRINTLAKEIAESKADILRLESEIEVLVPWSNLDISLNFNGTKSTKAFIGVLPNTWTLEMIYEKLANQMPLEVEIISSSKEQTCVFIVCNKSQKEAVAEVLRGIGFAHPNSVSDMIPREHLKAIEEEIDKLNVKISLAEKEIASYDTMRDDLLFMVDYETMRADKYEVLSHLYQSKKSFILTGYIPEKDVDDLVKAMNSKFNVSIELETPSDEDDVPVLLHNNAFSSPLESTVEAFSPPAKGEIDPTMVMSLFYYLLFGLMLSDAGYGAIIVIACGLALIKFKNTLEDGMRKTLKMYLFCGISTVFWGVMFGSYFGDIVDVVSDKFFGNKVMIPPLWFFPVNEPMRMLTFAMVLGMIHLLTGLTMKLYQLYKQKAYTAILYDVIFWYVLLASCVVALLSTEMFINILGLNFILPSMVGTIALVFAGLASVGIILTNGRESRHPFKRFLKGLYALYGISGYLSDVLSYSRLLALGLATGVICSVINKMAAMVPGGVIGAIIFTIIVVAGHALNLGINALGAYVHTNRLQYVEFFGKFYEGGGRKFNPFIANTKYYKFKERN